MPVGDDDALCTGRFDGRQQAGPVGVVRQHESAIETLPPPRAAQLHPAAGETIGIVAEALHPRRACSRLRRQYDGLLEQGLVFDIADILRGWQVNAGFQVGFVERSDRAVHEDGADAGIQPMQDALCLAEGITE